MTITKEHLQNCGYFCLDEYIQWTLDHDTWSGVTDMTRDSGLKHLLNIKKALGHALGAYHFPEDVGYKNKVDGTKIRGSLYKTTNWRHSVADYPDLANLEQKLIDLYPGLPGSDLEDTDIEDTDIDHLFGKKREPKQTFCDMGQDLSGWGTF